MSIVCLKLSEMLDINNNYTWQILPAMGFSFIFPLFRSRSCSRSDSLLSKSQSWIWTRSIILCPNDTFVISMSTWRKAVVKLLIFDAKVNNAQCSQQCCELCFCLWTANTIDKRLQLQQMKPCFRFALRIPSKSGQTVKPAMSTHTN